MEEETNKQVIEEVNGYGNTINLVSPSGVQLNIASNDLNFGELAGWFEYFWKKYILDNNKKDKGVSYA